MAYDWVSAGRPTGLRTRGSLSISGEKVRYSLLTDPSQDRGALARKGNGLCVIGRGAIHQVDVLGDLDWVPAFTYPIRLFIEAKFWESKVGIGVVRNAVGVLNDINQLPITLSGAAPARRFRYAYALFSTSGFTDPAIGMAVAHEISLVDIGGAPYSDLCAAIASSVARLRTPEAARADSATVEALSGEAGETAQVSQVRWALRTLLETASAPGPSSRPLPETIVRALQPVVSKTREVGDLFFGMAAGPHVLLIKASNREAFLQRMKRKPVVRVGIHWTTGDESTRTWRLTPTDGANPFELSFQLPETIGNWIFERPEDARGRALEFKRSALPHIFIPFKDDDGTSYLFRLDYDAAARSRGENDVQ